MSERTHVHTHFPRDFHRDIMTQPFSNTANLTPTPNILGTSSGVDAHRGFVRRSFTEQTQRL